MQKGGYIFDHLVPCYHLSIIQLLTSAMKIHQPEKVIYNNRTCFVKIDPLTLELLPLTLYLVSIGNYNAKAIY